MPDENPSSKSSARYRRLVLSEADIDQAVGWASALGRGVTEHIPIRADRDQLREALSVAFVVAYMRPFKYSRSDGETATQIEIESISSLTSSQLRLHRHIATLRNQVIAHTDAGPRQLDVCLHADLGRVPTSRAIPIEFSDVMVAELLGLAETVRAWIWDQLASENTEVIFHE